jgi:hypothetical protein
MTIDFELAILKKNPVMEITGLFLLGSTINYFILNAFLPGK